MSRLEFRGLAGRSFGPLKGSFDAGVTALLTESRESADELLGMITGRLRPKAGTVTIDGETPHGRPATRAKIGSVFPVEEYERGVDWVGSSSSPERVARGATLHHFGLDALAARDPASFDATEARSVRLAEALGAPLRSVVVLFEPLATRLSRERVTSEIDQHAASGTVVIAITASVRDALELGGAIFLFERRELVPIDLSLGVPGEFVVVVDDPRRFVSGLRDETTVTSVRFGAGAAEPVIVGGPNPQAVALSIARAAASTGVTVGAFARSAPTLAQIRSARASHSAGSQEGAGA